MPNIIKASYTIMRLPADPIGDIERAARTCYQSADLIALGTGEKLVRGLVEKGHWPVIEFGGCIWAQFGSNRGFTHEAVRHRLISAAQESTRYCNYLKEKFGSQITVCDPEDVIALKISDPEKRARYRLKMIASWTRAEAEYMDLVADGCPAELAREVLPIGLKSELNINANLVEWRHIFKLRTSKRAHPRMREVMIPLLAEVKQKVPIIFDDL
jgi:thymidylate synthase (FAD)